MVNPLLVLCYRVKILLNSLHLISDNFLPLNMKYIDNNIQVFVVNFIANSLLKTCCRYKTQRLAVTYVIPIA